MTRLLDVSDGGCDDMVDVTVHSELFIITPILDYVVPCIALIR